MDKTKAQEIIDHLSVNSGYTESFKKAVYELLPQLQFNYDIDTIFENFPILLEVDRIRTRFNNIHSIACTWHDIGPAPYAGDYMAASLNDNSDMFIVFLHPTDASRNIGVHVKERRFDTEIGFELNGVSYDDDNLISEDEVVQKLSKMISCLE